MTDESNRMFRKADLHIHTPVSACYGDTTVTPEQIVNTAIKAGLDIIAITDHNSSGAIAGIRKAAAGKGLSVFPGIELTTIAGHFLLLFDIGTPENKLDEFLTDVGILPAHRGDAATIAQGKIQEIFVKVEQYNGIVIAAHIERWPSGFLETNQPRKVKMGIHGSPYITALEITIPQNKKKWNNGKVRGYPKKYPCIQGSDAHALEETGRRPVCIEMEEISVENLRQAFIGHENRVKFPPEVL